MSGAECRARLLRGSSNDRENYARTVPTAVIGGALPHAAALPHSVFESRLEFLIFHLFLQPRKMSSNTHFRVILISLIASSFRMFGAADTRCLPLPSAFVIWYV